MAINHGFDFFFFFFVVVVVVVIVVVDLCISSYKSLIRIHILILNDKLT